MTRAVAVLVLAWAACSTLVIRGQGGGDGPQYEGSALVRPAGYRDWVFLSAGLGMNYDEPAPGAPPPARQMFTNVFVNPSAHRTFVQTGTWPQGTVLVLEIRSSSGSGSINKDGRFQTTLAGMEVHVKDTRFANDPRFRDGWAFFGFPRGRERAEPMTGDAVAGCVACHADHAAVDHTFVQFYPTLLEIAREKGTLKPGF